MRKNVTAAMLMLCLFLTGCAWNRKEEPARTKLTIWLDGENEYEVRNRIRVYSSVKKNPLIFKEDMKKYFPDIQWELVEKNYLSPEQYRQELARALENGEGPDIIYMDGRNGVDPVELIRSGALAGLGDFTSVWRDFEYVRGTLEAGQQDGENYVMPLYMECPVVFGLSAELEQAGIQTEEMYSSLGEFLDAMLAAHKRTGKQVFEDDAVIDWLEMYAMPDDQTLAAELTEKLEQIRVFCGKEEGQFGAYRALASGECLLGGCGVYDYKKLAANLSLFEKDQPVALSGIPDSTGNMQGILTHAVAVNAASEHVEEAVAALSMFQLRNVSWAPDIPVVDMNMDGILEYQSAKQQDADSVKALYDKNDTIQGKAARDFLKCMRKSVGSVSYVQGFSDRTADVQQAEKEKKVVSISYGDRGGDPDYPVTKWLNSAASAYEKEHEDICIQFLPRGVFDRDMYQYGVDMDACIHSGSVPETVAGTLCDFSALQHKAGSELDFLPDVWKEGLVYDGRVIGLPVWAEEFGIWCRRSLLEQAGLSEDWRPSDAAEMTDALVKIRQLLGQEAIAAVMDYDYELYQAMALFLSETQEDLLTQQDGNWRCSKEGWISYLSCLNNWSRQKLAVSGRDVREDQVALALADGETGVWIGSSSLSGWFDGSFGLQLTKEQQADMRFISLSPAANATMLTVSDHSGHEKEVFSFWKEAVQRPDYAQAVRGRSSIPVTEVSETVCRILPAKQGEQLDRLLDDVWDTDQSAEELAEKYPWFVWSEEDASE